MSRDTAGWNISELRDKVIEAINFARPEHEHEFLEQIRQIDALVTELGIQGCRPEAFPPGFIVFLDRPITREEAEHTYPRTPYTVEATMKDPIRESAMRALGETCALMSRYQNPESENSCQLEDELRSLDYSPVLIYFLERGLHRVKYYSDIDAFVFSFNDDGSALQFTRGDKVWDLTDSENLVRRGMIKPQPLTATGVSAALVPISNCPACSSIVTSTDRYCHHCAYDLSQVPQSGAYPATANSQEPTISMRCPGGCGSEIEAQPADWIDRLNTMIKSPCPYSCKVRVELWNLKVREAKKNQP